MAPQPPYRLDQLGWLQFERLATLVLEAETGLGDLHWLGDAGVSRIATVGDDVRLGDGSGHLRGPVTVAVVWVRENPSELTRLMDLIGALAQALGEPESRLLMVTNLDEALARKALPNALRTQGQSTLLGARAIGASLDRHPSVRVAMPSVLGVRDLEDLMTPEAVERSSLDVGAAQELARVFWPTRAYDRALEVLGHHGFVVLTGPPEMGKTAVGQMLALAKMTDGWEAHECTDPEQVWRAFDPGRRQVFVADDAFGSTEYRPDAGDRWASGLGRLLGMLDDEHWLIWTSRPAPLKAGLARIQRERGAERFPAPGEVLVDASELDLAEKTLILFRHVKHHGPSGAARSGVRLVGPKIVEHPHFTPERIRRFVAGRLDVLGALTFNDPVELMRAVKEELTSPTTAMRTSFNALEPEHRDLLLALLDAPAGLIDERELAETIRRHHVGGLSHAPSELIDRLTDHFLRVTSLGIGWVHPSWRDLVIEQLREDPLARQRFLTASGIDGMLLALSHAGGSAGERTLPLLISDQDWDTAGDRIHQLLRELDDRGVARLLGAVHEAVSLAPDVAVSREAGNLANGVLKTIGRSWDRAPGPIPLLLLEAWVGLNAVTGEWLDLPDLGLTWIELHPGSMLTEPLGRAQLAQIEDWLALAELLHRNVGALLMTFDFYARDKRLIAEAIPALARATTDPDLHDLAESVLARIDGLLPVLSDQTRRAIDVGRLAESEAADRWWVPDDLPVPPSHKLRTTETFTHRDVDRVLEDL